MTKNIKEKLWIGWLVFLADLEIIAISTNFFYGPINIAANGSTGISILVDVVWGINRSVTVLIANVLTLILVAVFSGKKATKNVILGSSLLPILMEITPSFRITDSRLLAIIYGGTLMELSISLLYRVNASSGDTTTPSMILKKYLYINPAIELLAIDMIIIFLNIFVDGWSTFLLAALPQVVTVMTMNYAEAGFDRKYQVRVMSNEHFEELKTMLPDNYNDLTIYDVVGGYSDDDKRQLLLVVDTREYSLLINKVHEIDSDAFVITDTAARVHGGQ